MQMNVHFKSTEAFNVAEALLAILGVVVHVVHAPAQETICTTHCRNCAHRNKHSDTYVPLQHSLFLRQAAKDALQLEGRSRSIGMRVRVVVRQVVSLRGAATTGSASPSTVSTEGSTTTALIKQRAMATSKVSKKARGDIMCQRFNECRTEQIATIK
jgi:hypothetical protein